MIWGQPYWHLRKGNTRKVFGVLCFSTGTSGDTSWVKVRVNGFSPEHQKIVHVIHVKSRKMALMNLLAGKEWRHGCGEWTCGHSRGGRGWDELRSGIDIYTPSCVKQITSEKLLYHTGKRAWPRRVRWEQGGSFRRERTYINIIMIDWGYCTAETNTTL